MSQVFKNGSIVPLSGGGSVVVKKLLGEGGQGFVYLVDYNGSPHALKYYKKSPGKAFRKNLEQNIDKGAPTSHFLWPKDITATDKQGCYGYIMDLRPQNFVEFSSILTAKAKWRSFSAMANAALQITYAFRELHRKGFSYQDLNDGNFFFDVNSGDVLICDNDNVSPYGVNMGIKGKGRYMAPEVVLGKTQPNDLSDIFSLSIILFMLLFGNHPLEGSRVASVPCMTNSAEQILYGSDPVFIYDPNRTDNRPVPALHRNVISRWGFYPEGIKQAFIKAFSGECCKNPNYRSPENEWIKVLVQFRSQIVKCSCGNETFLDLSSGANKCLWCGKQIPAPLILSVKNQMIPLIPEQNIYESQTSDNADAFSVVSGVVVKNANNPNLWGISNRSSATWSVVLPDGRSVVVPGGKGFPIYKGVKITFNNVQAEII